MCLCLYPSLFSPLLRFSYLSWTHADVALWAKERLIYRVTIPVPCGTAGCKNLIFTFTFRLTRCALSFCLCSSFRPPVLTKMSREKKVFRSKYTRARLFIWSTNGSINVWVVARQYGLARIAPQHRSIACVDSDERQQAYKFIRLQHCRYSIAWWSGSNIIVILASSHCDPIIDSFIKRFRLASPCVFKESFSKHQPRRISFVSFTLLFNLERDNEWLIVH